MLHAMNQVILQPYSILNHLKCCRTHHRTFGLSIQEPPTIWFHWISHVSVTIPLICQVPILSRGSTGTPKSLASVPLRSPLPNEGELVLCDVLHVPGLPYSLLSLG